MLAERQYPRLSREVRLVHPQGSDEYFAYRPSDGARYEMNEVSFTMVSMMTGENSVADICAAIGTEFSDSESVAEDVENLVSELVKERCVTLQQR